MALESRKPSEKESYVTNQFAGSSVIIITMLSLKSCHHTDACYDVSGYGHFAVIELHHNPLVFLMGDYMSTDLALQPLLPALRNPNINTNNHTHNQYTFQFQFSSTLQVTIAILNVNTTRLAPVYRILGVSSRDNTIICHHIYLYF